MQPFGFKFRLLTISIILLFLSACTPENNATTETSPGGTAPISSSPEPSEAVPGNQSATPTTQAVSATQTPEMVDIDWRDVPIMPEVSQRVFEIYQDGQAQGRDPHSFSVIGDCQSIPFVFMGPFGQGTLEPDSVEGYLWDALSYFSASIDRWSVTSRGGFTAASLLTSIQADPHYCKPGETPLTCEFRLNNPAFVFITLETWLDPNTIDRYEFYLREILDYVIGHGSVPILLTKADAAEVNEGTHVINPAIVRVARYYDVPLINFWRAAQYIDNAGIDPNRDGFHLSPEGYELKNILALRALYTIWQAVEPGNTGNNTDPGITSLTPTPVPGISSQNGPQVTAPDCAGGCLFFGSADSRDGTVTPRGVYAYNYASRQLIQVFGAGFDLQDVSQDGQRLLVNQANFLYEINLADASVNLVSNSFYWLGEQGAYWNSDDSAIVLIDQETPLQTESGAAFNLFPSGRDGEIYFDSGACASKDFCQSSGVFHLSPDQSASQMEAYARPVFSPDGELMAFLNPATATQDNYFHYSHFLLEAPDQGIASRRVIYFPEEELKYLDFPDVREYAFSPDNNKIFIIYDIYSAYFEQSQRIQTYMLNLSTGILYDLGEMKGPSGSLNPRLVWAPDGRKVLFFLTEVTPDNQFSINVYQTDLDTGERLIPYDDGLLTSSDYLYITNIYWR